MMVSLILGLVDESTGLLYYENAEHPFPVLYSHSKATFLDQSVMFRKLGFLGADSELRVVTFQMEPRDVLILGSDGRDDVVLSIKEDGSRVINEDETLFLRCVETGEGDLPRIFNKILEYGELMDDISLLRIGYMEHGPGPHTRLSDPAFVVLKEYRNAQGPDEFRNVARQLEDLPPEDRNHADVMRASVRSHIFAREYAAAARIGRNYIDMFPADTEMIYYTSCCYRKSGEPEKAVDLGERILLRKPDNVKNIINLARAYFDLNQPDRAVQILEKALAGEPENASLISLLKKAEGLGGRRKLRLVSQTRLR